MGEVKSSFGLCTTCNNSGACYYLALRGPAVFCELFDGRTPIETCSAAEPAAGLAGAPFARSIADSEAGRSIGLCVNCENLTMCVHPKPAAGVWHCEEYR